MLRAMIEDEAWPSAQAFTSWAKSVTVSPSIFRSMVTVEPQSFEWAVALASGAAKPPDPRNRPGQLDDAAIVDLVEHCRTADLPGRALGLLSPPANRLYRRRRGGIEVRAGAGAGRPRPLCRAIGETMDAAIKQRSADADRPRAQYARAGRAAAFARGGGGGGAGADRLYRRQSDARGLAGHAQARGRGPGRALSRLPRSAGQGAGAHLRRDRAL